MEYGRGHGVRAWGESWTRGGRDVVTSGAWYGNHDQGPRPCVWASEPLNPRAKVQGWCVESRPSESRRRMGVDVDVDMGRMAQVVSMAHDHDHG